MNRLSLTPLLTLSGVLLLCACSKPPSPDESKTFQGPDNGVVYVVETFYGSGAPSADYTRVLARAASSAGNEGQIVLSGENLTLQSIKWVNSTNVEICLGTGITDRYANEVFVKVKDKTLEIRNHLLEDCH